MRTHDEDVVGQKEIIRVRGRTDCEGRAKYRDAPASRNLSSATTGYIARLIERTKKSTYT